MTRSTLRTGSGKKGGVLVPHMDTSHIEGPSGKQVQTATCALTRVHTFTDNANLLFTKVIVCSIRSQKMHGGGPPVAPGRPLQKEYKEENLALLAEGVCNLQRHIEVRDIFKKMIFPI